MILIFYKKNQFYIEHKIVYIRIRLLYICTLRNFIIITSLLNYACHLRKIKHSPNQLNPIKKCNSTLSISNSRKAEDKTL